MIQSVLTHKQLCVLEFIQHYFDEHRRSPLIREVQLGCQIASYKSVLDRLNALERKKFIRRIPNKHRGIKMIRQRQQPVPVHAPLACASLPEAAG